MNLQKNLELNKIQNKIKQLNQKFDVECFIRNFVGGKIRTKNQRTSKDFIKK